MCEATYDSLGCFVCGNYFYLIYAPCTDSVYTPVTIYDCFTADSPGACNENMDCVLPL